MRVPLRRRRLTISSSGSVTNLFTRSSIACGRNEPKETSTLKTVLAALEELDDFGVRKSHSTACPRIGGSVEWLDDRSCEGFVSLDRRYQPDPEAPPPRRLGLGGCAIAPPLP